MIIKLIDINRRLKSLSESVVIDNNTIDSIYKKALNGNLPSIYTCIEQWNKIPGMSEQDKAYKAINLLDKVLESKNQTNINKTITLINEAVVSKFRDINSFIKAMSAKLGWFTRKAKTKDDTIKNPISVSIELMNDKVNQINNNIPGQDNGANTSTVEPFAGNDFAATESAYGQILEYAKKISHIDRILKNYNSISKRFNVDKILTETYTKKNIQETTLSMCNLIDTYDYNDYIKLNTVLETTWYGLNKFGFTNFDMTTMIESACNYFMLKKDGAKICKAILDATVITDPYKLQSLSYIMEDPDVKDKFTTTIKDMKDNIFQYCNEATSGVIITYDKENDNPPKNKVIQFSDAFNEFKKEEDKENGYIKMLDILFKNKESDLPDNILTVLEYVRIYLVIYTLTSMDKIKEWIFYISNRVMDGGYSLEIYRDLLSKLNQEKEISYNKINEEEDLEKKERLSIYVKYIEQFISDVVDTISNITGKSEDDIINISNPLDPPLSSEDDNNEEEELSEQDLQLLAYVPALLNEIKMDKYIDIDSYMENNLDIVPSDILIEICKFSRDYCPLIDRDHIINLMESESRKLSLGQKKISDKLSDKYSRINTYKDCIGILKEDFNDSKVMEVNEAYEFLKVFNMINEVLTLIESSYRSYDIPLMETSFENTLKMATERMKKGLSNLGDKEQEVSKNMDSTVNRFFEGIRRLFTTNQREAVIRGTICPSASQAMKMMLLSTGLAGVGSIGTKAAAAGAAKAAAGAVAGSKIAGGLSIAAKVLGALKFPVLAIISIITFIICSKKFKNKERQYVLDEIEVELQMVEKYIELADRKEDLVALKQLLTIKRSLERDRQRIQYGMKVSGQRVTPVQNTTSTGSY